MYTDECQVLSFRSVRRPKGERTNLPSRGAAPGHRLPLWRYRPPAFSRIESYPVCLFPKPFRTIYVYVVDHISVNMLGYHLCCHASRSVSFERCCFSGPPHKTKGAPSDGAPLESRRTAEDRWLRACARTPLGWDYLATFSCFSDARLPDRRQPEPSLSLLGLFPHRYSLYPVKHGPATP